MCSSECRKNLFHAVKQHDDNEKSGMPFDIPLLEIRVLNFRLLDGDLPVKLFSFNADPGKVGSFRPG